MQYFKSEDLIDKKEHLVDYIHKSANEIITNNLQLAFLLSHLYQDEQLLLLKDLRLNINFVDLIKRTKEEVLDRKQLKIIRIFLGIEEIKAHVPTETTSRYCGPEIRFFELLDYQVYVKEQIMTVLQNDNDINRVIVHMPTGTGKTKTSMHTIVEYYLNNMKKKGLIVWVAHTTTLLEQAEETLINVWTKIGYRELNIFRLYEDHEDSISMDDTGILFVGVQKLISILKKHPEQMDMLSGITKLVFFDEAHKSTALETKKTIQKLMKFIEGSKKGLVGLTATPGRNTNNDFANADLANFYDRNIITIDPLVIEQLRVSKLKAFNQKLSSLDIISYFQERKILSKLKREELEYDDVGLTDQINSVRKFNDLEDLSPEITRIFSQNINRNRKIIQRISELVLDKRQIILFACSVEHGKFLTSLLQINKISAMEIYGTTNSSQRVEIINKFRSSEISVLVNCGVLTTGFDSTNINCVFITRPTTSVVLYSQMIGRGLRGPKMGGNEECLLIDMKDNLGRYNDDNQIFKYFNNYWG